MYAFLKRGHKAWFEAVLPVLLVCAAVYLLCVPPLSQFYGKNPGYTWLLAVPWLDYVAQLGLYAVMALGLVHLLFLILMGWAACFLFGSELKSFFTRFLVVMGVFILFVAVVGSVFVAYSGENPVATFEKYNQAEVEEFLKLTDAKNLPADQMYFLKENLPSIVRYSLILTPALGVCAFVVILIFNLMIGRRLFVHLLPRNSFAWRINELVIPFDLVWIVIIAIATIVIDLLVTPIQMGVYISINLLLVSSMLYFFQGLSIVSYYFDKKQVGLLIRYFFYLTFFFLFQLVGLVLTGFGFFDSWFDFRKLNTIDEKPPAA